MKKLIEKWLLERAEQLRLAVAAKSRRQYRACCAHEAAASQLKKCAEELAELWSVEGTRGW
jgi:hypothetical protein